VDTSAVLERDVAARAGLGWIGKNTNLLATGLGSYFFIGIVLTTATLPADEGQPDRCGTCTACLDACPTRAFVAPYVLDARRCIAYLTIEHRGDVAEDLREGIGEWLFGCDICQEVCPWTRKARPGRDVALLPAVRRGHSRRSFTSTAMPSERASGTHPLARQARRTPEERGARPRQPGRCARRAGARARAQRRGGNRPARRRLGPRAGSGARGAGHGRLKVSRLDHFGVDVADLGRAERFYTEVLGMRVEMRLADQVLLSYGDGRCALFLKPDRPPADPRRSGTRSGSPTTPSRSPARTWPPPSGSSPSAPSRSTRRSTGATTIASTFSTPMGTSSSWSGTARSAGSAHGGVRTAC